MKNSLLLCLVFICFFVLPSCVKKDASAGNQQKVLTAVEAVRKRLSDSLHTAVPSLSVLIQTPSEKIFASAAAEEGLRITARTYYRFASMTKNFTATSILNMYEAGWLDYKAKIIDPMPGSTTPYVPATPDWDFPNKNIITIEQLLQHSAGVFDVDNDTVPGYKGHSYTEYTQMMDPTHQFTTTEMVKVLKDKNLVYFAPGTNHHYSNTGYSILAEIIKRVYTLRAGKEKTYGDYLLDSVTGSKAPMPITGLHFPVLASDITLPDPRLLGTVLNPGGTIEKFDKFNMSAQIGEGNVYGTMEDANTWIRSLMKGGNVLTRGTIQLMQKDLSPGAPDYALGCTFKQNLGYGHNGARIGYLNLMVYDPETDVSVVTQLSLWDLRDGFNSFIKCFNAIYDAGYAARTALGYPGKP
ncbi:MAG: serine hydrolase [Williamsia sp.]|nr:serine hydrolase [Williamsia sp.]